MHYHLEEFRPKYEPSTLLHHYDVSIPKIIIIPIIFGILSKSTTTQGVHNLYIILLYIEENMVTLYILKHLN